MTANDRIKQVRLALGMSQAEFARAIFISNGYVAELEGNHRRANDRIIHLISLTLGVNERWLRDGDGAMFYKTPAEKTRRMLSLFEGLPPKFQDYALQQLEQLAQTTKEE